MPEKLVITANVPEKKDKDGNIVQKAIGPFNLTVSTGATAAESIALFGDAAVKSNADDSWVVTLQSNMRSGMKRGESQEQLQARLGVAKMGISNKGGKIDPEQAYLAMFASATPQKQAEMLAELKKKASSK
jgi:hypothetical protein